MTTRTHNHGTIPAPACINRDIKRIAGNHAFFQQIVSEHYAQAARKNHGSCKKGCYRCCKGLFGITLLDALVLRSCLSKLTPMVRKWVLDGAKRQLDVLEKAGVF